MGFLLLWHNPAPVTSTVQLYLAQFQQLPGLPRALIGAARVTYSSDRPCALAQRPDGKFLRRNSSSGENVFSFSPA
jgi:hypothetical protein